METYFVVLFGLHTALVGPAVTGRALQPCTARGTSAGSGMWSGYSGGVAAKDVASGKFGFSHHFLS